MRSAGRLCRSWRPASAAAVAVTVLAGCGVGAGKAPTGVQLRVTDDFGRVPMFDSAQPKIEGEDTVVRLLQRNLPIETTTGGTFISSIDGLAGGETQDGRSAYWQYFRNGVLENRGAGSVRPGDGDRIWWDRFDGRQARVTAVVGSFPAPFVDGFDGQRLPVRLECAPRASAACDSAAAQLKAAGVTATRVEIAPDAKPTALRILVGAWNDVRKDPIAGRLERGPKISGVPATPSVSGLRPQRTDGRDLAAIPRGWGLIAATRTAREAPTWVVTGPTAKDAQTAAAGLRPADLAGRFAVLYRGERAQALPVAEGE